MRNGDAAGQAGGGLALAGQRGGREGAGSVARPDPATSDASRPITASLSGPPSASRSTRSVLMMEDSVGQRTFWLYSG